LWEWLILLLFGPLVFASIFILVVSNNLAASLGSNLGGFLAQAGGVVLFFGLVFGYAVIYTRALAKRNKLDPDRPYSADLTSLSEELVAEVPPAGQAEKRAFITGLVTGVRLTGDSFDSDEKVATELRRRRILTPRS
jgi:hypothetical protein